MYESTSSCYRYVIPRSNIASVASVAEFVYRISSFGYVNPLHYRMDENSCSKVSNDELLMTLELLLVPSRRFLRRTVKRVLPERASSVCMRT